MYSTNICIPSAAAGYTVFWCCWPLNTVYKYKQTFEKAFKLSNKVQKGERQG